MLKGSLDTFALPDVLAFVAKAQVTGRIEISRDELAGEISVDRGQFVAARLVEDDAPSTVDETLDVAVLLFDGSGGEFSLVSEDWVGGPLDLDAEQLIVAVERRRQEWADVVRVLGSLEDPIALVTDLPEGTGQVTVRADQWRLISLVDGQRSVQDIARDSAQSVYATAVAMADLANAGMVTRGGGVQRTPRPRKGRHKVEEEPAEVLADLADSEEAAEDAGGAQQAPARATVRPLRAPTREEQRLRLRR